MRAQILVRALPALGMAVCLMTFAACHHEEAKATPPAPAAPAAPPPRPTVTLQASPTFIEQGQSSQLSWSSTNATTVVLAGENVAPEGSKAVQPEQSTTYSITASGPGGDAATSVRVTVSPAARGAEVRNGAAGGKSAGVAPRIDSRPGPRAQAESRCCEE